MDLRQMRYVLAVAEHGNVRRAAQAIHVAQQSLSEQIAVVEREVGAALFERSRAGMALTDPGEVFVAHATVAVTSAERVLSATRAAAGSAAAAPLRLAVASGLAPLAGELVRRYLDAHPDSELRFADLGSADQVAAIRDGAVTGGVAYRLPQRALRGLISHQLAESPVRVLLRRDDPLADRPVVPLADLTSRPLLLPPTTGGGGPAAHLLALFAAAGLSPRLGPQVYGHEVAAAYVAAGNGYTLCVPETARIADDLVFRPLAEPVAPLIVTLLTRRGDRSPVVMGLLAAANALHTRLPTVGRPGRTPQSRASGGNRLDGWAAPGAP